MFKKGFFFYQGIIFNLIFFSISLILFIKIMYTIWVFLKTKQHFIVFYNLLMKSDIIFRAIYRKSNARDSTQINIIVSNSLQAIKATAIPFLQKYMRTVYKTAKINT